MAKGTLRVNGVLVASEIHKIVQESGTGSGGGTGVGDEILLETGFHILTEVSATAAIQAQTGDNIVIREDDGSAVLTVDTSGVATFTGNVNVGTDDVGHDVKFHGATAGSYMLWDESIDDLIVGGAGRVGIGTTTPQYGLEVATATGGDISFLRDDTSIAANDTIGTLHFAGNDPSHRVGAQIKVNAHDAWATNDCPTYMTFHTTDDATASIDERMRITHNGNIGIGTTAPTNLLHLAESDTSSVYLQFSNSTTGHAGTDGFFIGVNGGGTAAVNLWNLENTAMRFATNDTQRMTILGNGKVGIGTDTPNTHLEVSDTVPTFRLNSTETNVGDTDILGEISWKSADSNRTGDPIAYIRALSENATGSATALTFGTGFDSNNASERMRIKNSGNVGIGTTNPATALTVSRAFGGDTNFLSIISTGTVLHRNLYFTNTHLYFYNGTNNPYLSGTGAWTDASDENIKKNIEDIDYGLETINTLKPRKFKHKADDVEDIGFIAQEVEKVVPEIVPSVGPDESAGKGLAYGRLTSILTKAVQELSAKNDALEAKVTALENA